MAKTVVAITGASSGIGAEFARRLAMGHDLLLIARRKDRLEALASELTRTYGSAVEVLQADLALERDVEMVAEHLASEPRLGLLINGAGFGSKGLFWEASLESQDQMHKLHVMAPMRLTHAALRNMVPRDFGGVINISSVAAYVRMPGATSYAATKTWMNTFTEGLYLELRSLRSNVTVQALCPGYTYSEFHDTMEVSREKLAPSSFWMSAEEVVEASLNGLRDRRLFVVPGWRNRLLTSIASKLPTALRLQVEALGGRRMRRELVASKDLKRVGGK